MEKNTKGKAAERRGNFWPRIKQIKHDWKYNNDYVDSGMLQQADDVIGIYSDEPGAVSSYTIAVPEAQKF